MTEDKRTDWDNTAQQFTTTGYEPLSPGEGGLLNISGFITEKLSY